MSEPMPGLLVARHVLWRIAMLCTVVSVVVVVITSLIPGATLSATFGFAAVLTGIFLYTGIACWIAYAVVRLVATYRLKSPE